MVKGMSYSEEERRVCVYWAGGWRRKWPRNTVNLCLIIQQRIQKGGKISGLLGGRWWEARADLRTQTENVCSFREILREGLDAGELPWSKLYSTDQGKRSGCSMSQNKHGYITGRRMVSLICSEFLGCRWKARVVNVESHSSGPTV